MGQDLSISVIIDAYDYGRFIGKAIESVLDQTLPAQQREIIVIDDGSTDDTCEQVGRFGAEVRYMRKDNGGQASAFNAGVTAAEGDIVCFLDADDYFYPDKLSQVQAEFGRCPDMGVLYNRYDIVDENDAILARSMPRKIYCGNIEGRILLGYVSGSPSSGISVRREVVSRITIPVAPFRISADYFYLNILPLITRIGVLGTSLHAYRLHTSNLYLKKSKEAQQKIHQDQQTAVWSYADEKLGKKFRTGLNTMRWIGDAADPGIQLRAFARATTEIMTTNASLALRVWTLSKLASKFLMPTTAYTRLQETRNRWVLPK